MFKAILLASAHPRAFSADVVETVNIKGADGKALRVNKSDYDADQADGGAKKMTLHKDEPQQGAPAGAIVGLADGVIQAPAPSAPDFKGMGGGGANKSDVQVPNPPVDEATGAAMPTVPSPGQLLVMKETTGKGASAKDTYYVVDAAGTKITDKDGIDKGGYASEQDAWNAILALPH